jgi:hypothetical protein
MSAKAKDLAANLFHARQELIHAEAQADLNLGGDAYMIGDRDLTAVEIDVGRDRIERALASAEYAVCRLKAALKVLPPDPKKRHDQEPSEDTKRWMAASERPGPAEERGAVPSSGVPVASQPPV